MRMVNILGKLIEYNWFSNVQILNILKDHSFNDIGQSFFGFFHYWQEWPNMWHAFSFNHIKISPHSRITLDEVLKHPYFLSLDNRRHTAFNEEEIG